MRKRTFFVGLCIVFLLTVLASMPVFAEAAPSAAEEFVVPEATLEDYLLVTGVWVGSMLLAMAVYYLYLRWKRKKNGGVDKYGRKW